jgi:hypothetical protein
MSQTLSQYGVVKDLRELVDSGRGGLGQKWRGLAEPDGLLAGLKELLRAAKVDATKDIWDAFNDCSVHLMNSREKIGLFHSETIHENLNELVGRIHRHACALAALAEATARLLHAHALEQEGQARMLTLWHSASQQLNWKPGTGTDPGDRSNRSF